MSVAQMVSLVCARIVNVEFRAAQVPQLVQQVTQDLTDFKSAPFSA
jgi:hypothetical protein